jgi:hypothetical protein
MNDDEHKVQVAICQYLDLRGVLYFAIPNGGNRNIITAKKLKASGVQKGTPDLCIVFEGMAYFLEVKKPATVGSRKGVLSLTQKAMIERIEEAGGEVAVVYSVADVIQQCIEWHINVL